MLYGGTTRYDLKQQHKAHNPICKYIRIYTYSNINLWQNDFCLVNKQEFLLVQLLID